MSCRWREFLEDADSRLSSTRLCMLYGVFLGGIIVSWLTYKGTIGWEMFSAFLAASGGVYSLGKWRESAVEMQQIKSDSPNQELPTTLISGGDNNVDSNRPKLRKNRKR